MDSMIHSYTDIHFISAIWIDANGNDMWMKYMGFRFFPLTSVFILFVNMFDNIASAIFTIE